MSHTVGLCYFVPLLSTPSLDIELLAPAPLSPVQSGLTRRLRETAEGIPTEIWISGGNHPFLQDASKTKSLKFNLAVDDFYGQIEEFFSKGLTENEMKINRKLDIPNFTSCILGGLVSITAICAICRPHEALIIGFIGGVIVSYGRVVLFRTPS